jgi:hypothetical protein
MFGRNTDPASKRNTEPSLIGLMAHRTPIRCPRALPSADARNRQTNHQRIGKVSRGAVAVPRCADKHGAADRRGRFRCTLWSLAPEREPVQADPRELSPSNG